MAGKTTTIQVVPPTAIFSVKKLKKSLPNDDKPNNLKDDEPPGRVLRNVFPWSKPASIQTIQKGL